MNATLRQPTKTPTTDGVPKATPSILLETSTVAGAATGAVVGAIGGPPGAIVGATIGAAVGMMAGSALEMATEAAAGHDRDLDDIIGVTAGDLGAREEAAAGLGRHEHAEIVEREIDDPEHVEWVASLLRAEHARVEQAYGRFLDASSRGEWAAVRSAWNAFEPALRAHLLAEESRIFPAFRSFDAEETNALIAEHDELRRRLDTLARNIDLYVVTAPAAEELARRLREHGLREERLLYPWIDPGSGAADGSSLEPHSQARGLHRART